MPKRSKEMESHILTIITEVLKQHSSLFKDVKYLDDGESCLIAADATGRAVFYVEIIAIDLLDESYLDASAETG